MKYLLALCFAGCCIGYALLGLWGIVEMVKIGSWLGAIFIAALCFPGAIGSGVATYAIINDA